VLLVLAGEAALLEGVELAIAHVLNRVERLAALFKSRGRHVVSLVVALLQFRESALIDTFDEFGLDWHLRVLVEHLVAGE
jgi:hypothetical protein